MIGNSLMKFPKDRTAPPPTLPGQGGEFRIQCDSWRVDRPECNYPNNWKMRNEAMLQRVAVRGNLLIYDLLHDLRPVILDEIVQITLRPEKSRISSIISIWTILSN